MNAFWLGRDAFLALLIYLLGSGCNSLQHNQLEKSPSRLYAGEFQEIPYQLLTFEPQNRDERFALVFALHGTGMNGKQYLEIWKKEAARRRVMVLAPTIEILNLEKFYALVDEISRQYPVDQKKIFLAGVSSGALLARWMLTKRPDFWKGVIFVASPTEEWWAGSVDLGGYPPILYVHGGRDKQFEINKIQHFVDYLKSKGVDTEFFPDAKAGHEHKSEWNSKIFQWIQDHSEAGKA